MQNDEHDELYTWQIKSVIDQAKQLGVIQVCFTGGEPLLREDIVELVRYAHDAGLITRIMTNGLLLARERVIKLKEAGLTQCSVSIDDADPDTHDRLRGLPGTYKKALDGIKTLQEFNILCQILTVAYKRNITAGLEKIIALGRQLGLMCVYIIFPVATGRWDGAFEQLLSEEEKARVRELEDLTFVRLEIPAPLSMCCVVAKSALFVSPRGDVTPCPYVPYVIGNIEDHTLKDLWERYCAALSPECRGECPMNDVRHREALKKHVDSVARCLR
jgi:MoaA/NifB/PqqE/SkfB family radical SAM enzyme